MMLLPQYDDYTYEYLGIDGNKRYKFSNEAEVLSTQDEDEDREEYIHNKGLSFTKNQYGSNIVLDEQCNDDNVETRISVVKQNYALDKLIEDEDENVRVEVARQNYKLDVLVHDKSPVVRRVVAEQGYGADILWDDEDVRVRRILAKQGIRTAEYLNDDHPYVRKDAYNYLNYEADEDTQLEIAEKCYEMYGLDIEIKSGGPEISSAYIILIEHNKYLHEFASNEYSMVSSQAHVKLYWLEQWAKGDK